MDKNQHYEELEQHTDKKALDEFHRKPYGVAEQLQKWGIDTRKGVTEDGH